MSKTNIMNKSSFDKNKAMRALFTSLIGLKDTSRLKSIY